MISFQFHFVPIAGFAGLMATAAIEDFRRLLIPNAVTLALCVLWPLHLATAPAMTLATAAAAAGGALGVFLGGALVFSRGLIGGGDVKLLAVATLWAGPSAAPSLLVLTALLGGVLSLFLLTPLGTLITPARPALSSTGDAAIVKADQVPVPYGIAIAAAALIVTIPPNFA